jgi:hypothetical protein
MSRRAATFTQADAARALRAARQVAPGPWRLRISPGGEIIVEPAAPVEAPEPGAGEPEPLACGLGVDL